MDKILQAKLDDLISQSKVVLFMKWSPEEPMCGFSSTAVAILVESGVYFESVDILLDEEVRQWLKEYKNWPTFPQLYIDGELIGGVDIMQEMYDDGEFEQYK